MKAELVVARALPGGCNNGGGVVFLTSFIIFISKIYTAETDLIFNIFENVCVWEYKYQQVYTHLQV